MSRYLVDGIVIGGLVVGTLGVLYLANGVFGPQGNAILRRVFVVVFCGLLFVPSGYLYVATTRPHVLLIFGVPRSLSTGILALLFGLVTGYLILQIEQKPLKWFEGSSLLELGIGCAILGATFLLSSGTLVTYRHQTLVPAMATVGAVMATLAGLIFVVSSLARQSQHWSDRHFQIVGLTCTLLGIATEFIPPVLDLLGVKVG